MIDIVVGLGSNLGDRLEHLRAATRQLAARFDLRARSAVYETPPVGPPQPDYLNAAVRLLAACQPEDVMDQLLEIERTGGRVRTADGRWGPRTIDLDFLWGNGVVLSSAGLTVPHPRLTERLFALQPLLDVAPEAIDPRTGQRFVLPSGQGEIERTALIL